MAGGHASVRITRTDAGFHLALSATYSGAATISSLIAGAPFDIDAGSDPSWTLNGSGHPLAPEAGLYIVTCYGSVSPDVAATWEQWALQDAGTASQTAPIGATGANSYVTVTEVVRLAALGPLVVNVSLYPSGASGNLDLTLNLTAYRIAL